MAWPQDGQEKARRVTVAKMLDRQEFWRAVYVASISSGLMYLDAKANADQALEDYDEKFGDVS